MIGKVSLFSSLGKFGLLIFWSEQVFRLRAFLSCPTCLPSHPDHFRTVACWGFRSLHGCGAAGESPYGSLLFPDFQPG